MATDLPTLTGALEAGRDLSAAEAGAAAHAMISAGETDDAKAAFLLALARRGETAVEVAAFAHAYRERARVVDFGDVPSRAIDIVGTGGDRSGSFNISSASSLIVAAAGVPVLKHGNRSITSKSGSADFLAGLGVALEATDDQLCRALREAGFCYLYAPAFHPAFKAVLGVRKRLAEQGHKTLFNVLGPLINPARPAAMMVGVYDERWVAPMAAALGELGVRRGLVVHGRAGGGMDELTTAGETRVRGCGELAAVDGVWLPGDFGFKTSPVADLRGGSPEENLVLFSDLLVGAVPEGLLDTLCLSAGAALWVAGRATDVGAGAVRARQIVLGGELREQARRLREAYREG
ncbi:MAG: anthranilate phosphoribosyltransferase [Verrucomicrobiota bacterium]|jgi:anthranilate phosphoribosyltransferase